MNNKHLLYSLMMSHKILLSSHMILIFQLQQKYFMMITVTFLVSDILKHLKSLVTLKEQVLYKHFFHSKSTLCATKISLVLVKGMSNLLMESEPAHQVLSCNTWLVAPFFHLHKFSNF